MFGNNNPSKREEVRVKLKKNHWTKSGKWTKEEIRYKLNKNRNFTKTEEHKRRISNALKGRKGRKHSKESIKKLSIAVTGNKNPNYGGKCYTCKRIKYKNIMFRSSWEVIVAKWLDGKNYTWKYEPKRFYFNNKKFTYLPDFYVEELNSYIEVKGWWRNQCKEKVKLFKKEYSKLNLIIIDKKNINEYI